MDEYLRRNLIHAKAVGVVGEIQMALRRVEAWERPPHWLCRSLRFALRRAEALPSELARWRDLEDTTP